MLVSSCSRRHRGWMAGKWGECAVRVKPDGIGGGGRARVGGGGGGGGGCGGSGGRGRRRAGAPRLPVSCKGGGPIHRGGAGCAGGGGPGAAPPARGLPTFWPAPPPPRGW